MIDRKSRHSGLVLWIFSWLILLAPSERKDDGRDKEWWQSQLAERKIGGVHIDLNVRIEVPVSQNPHAQGPRTVWASVFLPSHAPEEKLPTILVSTAYRRELITALQLPLLRHGYALVGVDSYGTGSTAGDWEALGLREQYDIKYVIDHWVPSQPWANGKVGMIGPSYMGLTQLLVAGLVDRDPLSGRSKHLKAIMPLGAGSDLYQEATMGGGNLGLSFRLGWVAFTEAFKILPPTLILGEHGFPTWKDIQETVSIWKSHLQRVKNYFEMAFVKPEYLKQSSWYAERSPMTYWPSKPKEAWTFPEAKKTIPPDLAVFSVGGWFDIFTRGTLNNYQYGLSQTPPTHKALLVGEWYHFSTAFSFGAWPLQTAEVASRWFDIHLKGKVDPFVKEFPVLLHVLGEKRWRAEKSWPLPPERRAPKSFFLSHKRPSPIEGDWYTHHSENESTQFSLGEKRDETVGEGADPTMIHKANPLQWHGLVSRSHARWLAGALSLPGELAALARWQEQERMIFEDERFDEKGALTFTTEPLAEDLEIVGPLYLSFWAKTRFQEAQSPLGRWAQRELEKLWDRLPPSMIKAQMGERDVQWVVELNDVFPDGRARNITSGWLRASRRPHGGDSRDAWNRFPLDPEYLPGDPFYRKAWESPQPIVEGEVYQYSIELWPTLNRFKKGHRLRLSLSGSDFPHLVPILVGSENTILLDADHEGRLDFEVVRPEGEGHLYRWIEDINQHLLSVPDE